MYIIKDDKKQFVLRLFLLFFAVYFLLLIPKVAIDNHQNCEWLKTEEYVVYQYGNNFTSYHWEFDYEEAPHFPLEAYLFHTNTTYSHEYVCEELSTQTANIFYKFVLRFQVLLYIYMFVYLVMEVLIWRGLIPNDLWGKKKKK